MTRATAGAAALEARAEASARGDAPGARTADDRMEGAIQRKDKAMSDFVILTSFFSTVLADPGMRSLDGA